MKIKKILFYQICKTLDIQILRGRSFVYDTAPSKHLNEMRHEMSLELHCSPNDLFHVEVIDTLLNNRNHFIKKCYQEDFERYIKLIVFH